MEFEYTNDFTVKSLGKREETVYDVETEDHTFFGNDILLHNSNYMDLTDVLNKFYTKRPDADRNLATDFLDKFCKSVEDRALIPLFEKMANELNWHDGPGMHMDREAIAVPYRKTGYSGVWFAKKRYYLCVSDMEDYRYEEPHAKIMGLYSVTSTCPNWIKPWYNSVIQNLIENGVDAARKVVKDFKEIFYTKTVSEIASQTSVSDVDRYIDTRKEVENEGLDRMFSPTIENPNYGLPWKDKWVDKILGKDRNGGIPINAKAAIHHNWLIKHLGLEKEIQPIRNGDKMKWLYLNPKANRYGFDVIGFIDNLPEKFNLTKSVDIDRHYDRLFYKPITDVFTACNLDVEDKSETLCIDNFF